MFLKMMTLAMSLILALTSISHAQNNQALAMLEGFRQGCSVGGGSVSEVLSMIKQLSSAVQAAQSDEKCKSVLDVTTSLNNTALQARSMYPNMFETQYNNDTDVRAAGLNRKKQEILFLITQTSDSTELADLKIQLRQTQLDLQQAQGEAKALEFNEEKIRKARALSIISQNTYAALDTLLANESCLLAKPSLLESVAGVSVGVANSVSALSPVGSVAALVGWGAGIIGKVMSFFKRKSVEAKIAGFDRDIMPIYMTCALEKMNSMYCAAEDTLSALDKYKESQARISKADPIWQGSEILNKVMPIAFEWLNRVKNGGSVATTSDAGKLNNLDNLENELRKSQRWADGMISDYQTNYNPVSPVDSRWVDLRGLVSDLSNTVCHPNGSNNPICNFTNNDKMKFYLVGVDEIKYECLKVRNSNVVPLFDNFQTPDVLLESLKNCDFKADLGYTSDLVSARFKELYSKGEVRLNELKQRAGLGDLALIFAVATSPSPNYSQKEITPLKAWHLILDYLSNAPSTIRIQFQSKFGIKEEVMQVIQVIISNIRCAKDGSCTLVAARKNIMEATRVLKDSSELSNRLKYLVRSYVDFYVYENPEEPDSLALQYLASRSFLDEMQVYYGPGTKISIRDNATAIQATVVTGLKNFQATYKTAIKESFDTLNSYMKEDPRAFGNLKNVFCYQTLSLGWDDSFKACENVQAMPLISRGYSGLKISKEVYSQPRGKRTCAYRNFLRWNAIAERRSQQRPN